MCQRHYKQNDVDWILELSKWRLWNIGEVRQRIVVLLVGSLASLETKRAQRKIWDRILGRENKAFYVDHTEPDSESDEDYDYIPHKRGRSFCARGLRPFINPLNKLRYGHAFTLVLEFLGNYQLKTRKR